MVRSTQTRSQTRQNQEFSGTEGLNKRNSDPITNKQKSNPAKVCRKETSPGGETDTENFELAASVPSSFYRGGWLDCAAGPSGAAAAAPIGVAHKSRRCHGGPIDATPIRRLPTGLAEGELEGEGRRKQHKTTPPRPPPPPPPPPPLDWHRTTPYNHVIYMWPRPPPQTLRCFLRSYLVLCAKPLNSLQSMMPVCFTMFTKVLTHFGILSITFNSMLERVFHLTLTCSNTFRAHLSTHCRWLWRTLIKLLCFGTRFLIFWKNACKERAFILLLFISYHFASCSFFYCHWFVSLYFRANPDSFF